LAALLEPIRQLLAGSPLFFIVQGRCIGHYLAAEFALGGADYVATGRGIGIKRVMFHKLYASFAASCIYPGAEMAAMLALAMACSTNMRPPAYAVAFASITPFALIMGPFLFNPQCFSALANVQDARQWFARLLDAGADGWVAQWAATVGKKRTLSLHALIWPQKELFLGCATLLTIYEATRMSPLGWTPAHMLFVALPLVPTALMAVLVAACKLISITRLFGELLPLGPRGYALGAFLCAATAAAEIIVVYYSSVHDKQLKFPTATFWAGLATARYFCYRSAFRGIICLDAIVPVPQLLSAVLQLTVGAHAMLLDVIIGGVLQLVMLLASLIPFFSELHVIFLFRTNSSGLRASTRKQTKGEAQGDQNEAAAKPTARRSVWRLVKAGSYGIKNEKSMINAKEFSVAFPALNTRKSVLNTLAGERLAFEDAEAVSQLRGLATTMQTPKPMIGAVGGQGSVASMKQLSQQLSDGLISQEVFNVKRQGIIDSL